MPAYPATASAIERWAFAGYGRESPEAFGEGELSRQGASWLLGGAGACGDAVRWVLGCGQARVIRYVPCAADAP